MVTTYKQFESNLHQIHQKPSTTSDEIINISNSNEPKLKKTILEGILDNDLDALGKIFGASLIAISLFCNTLIFTEIAYSHSHKATKLQIESEYNNLPFFAKPGKYLALKLFYD